MTAALRRLINTALTAALLRLRAVAAATAARRLALRLWRGAAVVHALRTWRDAAALASRTGKVLRSVASLLVHRDVARGWRSWIALTAAHQRLHVVVWRVLQHQSVLALNTWRHGAAPHPAPHPVLHRAPHPPLPPHASLCSSPPATPPHTRRPVAAERAATRLQLRKVIAAWASALLRAIVRGWAEAAQHEAAARRRVIALTAYARARARAWRTWATAAAARVRALRLVEGCLVQLTRGAERRAFNSLAAAAAPRACGRAVLRVWCRALLGRAFRSWRGVHEARGAVRALLGRAVGQWRGESAVRAWAAWRARTAAAVAIEESLARVIAHWRGGRLLRALNSWRAAADAAQKAWVLAQAHRLHPARRSLRALRRAVARERQMAHALAHWWGGSAASAFNTWRGRAAACAAQRERACAAVARWWHVLRTAAWNTWAARAAAAVHARRQLVAALHFWRGCEVAVAWRTWVDHAARRGVGGGSARESAARGEAVLPPEGGVTLADVHSDSAADVVVFGGGGFGQLGDGGARLSLPPTWLRGLRRLRVQAAACGELHTALLTAAGEVFTFGVGEFGVLGHGSEDRALLPRRVSRGVKGPPPRASARDARA